MIKCWYHSADLDGKCSGAIVKFLHPEAELHPIDYGAEFPWEKVAGDDLVYMVDFCLQPFEDMITLANKVGKLVWIDHHKTAIEAYIEQTLEDREAFTANTRMGIGACQLVWEYLLPNRPVPLSVQLIAQADVGDWRDPQALPFKYGMSTRSTRPHEHIWRQLFSESVSVGGIANDGRIIQSFQRQADADAAREVAFETQFDGLSLIAANKAKPNSGFLFSVYDRDRHDAMACFYWRKNRWLMDMYTKDDNLNLGAFCRKWGGGGHRRAAGMTLTPHVIKHFSVNPFDEIL